MEIKVKYSKRKTLALEITRDAQVLVRAPIGTSKKRIDEFTKSHWEWMISHLEKRKSTNKRHPEPSAEELDILKAQAWEIIPKKVEKYAAIMGVFPEHVSINSAKTRFGSCSSKKRLNFSCRLMAYDERAIDYVVVHELAHLKHLNHSKSFWAYVEKFMPDYKERKKLLK
ncbi:MAG: M48 family metallopeptidase [Clostridia bacterium]|nr:M48 family metallopeptidase [Clostridia bacterium]